MSRAKQLERDFWQNLKTAMSQPESADLTRLWQHLESAVAAVESEQKLPLVAEAIASIVEVFAIRAERLLANFESKDNSAGPILSDGFLDGLMRQSMSIDLSDMMEDWSWQELPQRQTQENKHGSMAVPVDRQTARAIARQARVDAKLLLSQLAGVEQVSQWTSAIATWMQQHDYEAISLLDLQQALGMPLVEVWLGLLLSPHQYEWEIQGGFYSVPNQIFLKHKQIST